MAPPLSRGWISLFEWTKPPRAAKKFGRRRRATAAEEVGNIRKKTAASESDNSSRYSQPRSLSAHWASGPLIRGAHVQLHPSDKSLLVDCSKMVTETQSPRRQRLASDWKHRSCQVLSRGSFLIFLGGRGVYLILAMKWKISRSPTMDMKNVCWRGRRHIEDKTIEIWDRLIYWPLPTRYSSIQIVLK